METKDSTSGVTLLLQLCFLVAIACVMTGKSSAVIKPQVPCVQSTEDGTYVLTTHSGRCHRREGTVADLMGFLSGETASARDASQLLNS